MTIDRDRFEILRGETVVANKQLVSPKTEDRARQAMLETIDRHELSGAFDVLATTDPQDEYVQLMSQQLQQGDAERRQVILKSGLFPASKAGWDLTPLLDRIVPICSIRNRTIRCGMPRQICTWN